MPKEISDTSLCPYISTCRNSEHTLNKITAASSVTHFHFENITSTFLHDHQCTEHIVLFFIHNTTTEVNCL